METLRREWRLWREQFPAIGHANLASIFFGGGTPNLLGADEISPLLTDVLAGVGGMDTGLEITMEMNPALSDMSALARLRDAGVNRASLGVQSTHDALLQGLGRDHTAEDAERLFMTAREVGFDSVNVDLIFAVPGQTLDAWSATLAEAIAWKPDHICTYNLTVKDETPLMTRVRAGEIALPDEDTQTAMYVAAHDQLTGAGFEHVEISNFAKPGHACRHNGDVWRGEPYIGLGLGAHSCFAGERSWNTAVWEDYHKSIARGELARCIDHDRDEHAIRAEQLYLGLRTREGVGLETIGKSANEKIQTLVDEGLAEIDENRLRLTLAGWCVADAVVQELM
jgi:oxygen-independent coproporphyrinogen-3 oxidase